MNIFIPICCMLSACVGYVNKSEYYDGFNENCKPQYSLAVNEFSSQLIEKESKKVVKTFYNYDNPYLIKDLDFFIYTEKEGLHYLGIKNNNLINLENNSLINVDNKVGKSILDALESINYSTDFNNIDYSCKYMYYFKNLHKEQIAINKKCECTLVAMEILFQYYDALYDESMIPETFNWISVGNYTCCKDFPYSPGLENRDIYHNKLINDTKTFFGESVIEKEGLSNVEQFHFLENYLKNDTDVKFSWLTSEGNWNDIFSGKQFKVAQNAIKNGRPVIINTLQHSMVAFAYNDDYVYLMTGWTDMMMAKLKWDYFNGNIFNNICGAYDLVIESEQQRTCSYFNSELCEFICPKCGG